MPQVTETMASVRPSDTPASRACIGEAPALAGVVAAPARAAGGRTVALIVLLGATTALCCFGLRDASLNVYDEGVMLTGAALVQDGALPHRDFWTLYPPGQFAVLAGVFDLLGATFESAMLLDALVKGAVAALAAWHAIRLAGLRAGLATWLLSTLWMWSLGGFRALPTLPATGLVLAAIAAASTERWNRTRAALAGAWVGAAVLFRHDFGIPVALVLAVMLGGRSRFTGVRTSSHLAGFAVGAAAIALPPLLWIAAGDAQAFLEDLVGFPVTRYAAVRALPYPPFDSGRARAPVATVLWLVPFYLHFLVGALALVGSIRDRRSDGRAFRVVLLTLAMLVLSAKGLVRPRSAHLLPVTVLTFTLVPYLLARHWNWASGRRWRVLVTVSALFVLGGAFARPLLDDLAAGRLTAAWQLRAGCVPRAVGARLSSEQCAALRYVRERTRPDEALFVGTTRHDRVFAGDVAFYFLAERRPATRYYELHPGVTTTRLAQEEIVRSLEAQNVRSVVLFDGFDDRREPNESSASSGIAVLDEYLRTRFREVRRYGHHAIWERAPRSVR